MNKFLDDCKKAVSCGKLNACDSVTVVIGNEASDLDSVVSTIVWAYFLSAFSNPGSNCYVPTLNIMKNEFKLRTEVVYWLKQCLFPVESKPLEDILIFREELDFTSLAKSGQLRLILTDHNTVTTELQSFQENIVQIIDHHLPGPNVHTQRDTVETVGSCSTLIAEKIFADRPQFLSERPEICRLILGTIITDTAALKKVPGKATDKDIAVADTLESLLGISDKSARIGIFEEIDAAKSDVSELSALEILDKDCKFIDSVALSSVPIEFDEFYAEKCAGDDIRLKGIFEEFCRAKQVQALVMLAVFRRDKSQQMKDREVSVFSENKGLKQKIVHILTTQGNVVGLDLKLELRRHISNHTVLFNQGNIYQGRKDILPAVKNELLKVKSINISKIREGW